MLSHRLWMGALLILLAAAVLFFDSAPTYPFLLVLIGLLGVAAVAELHALLTPSLRPPLWLCLAGTVALLMANWVGEPRFKVPGFPDSGRMTAGILTAAVMAAFVAEMIAYREPGGSVPRIAIACWILLYLGYLPGFLVHLRFDEKKGLAYLALAIFVPKCCDIGAYAAGRLFGRHRMAPILSPSKTYEGLAGGLVLAVVAAVVLNQWQKAGLSDVSAVGFGLTVGAAGVLGDLAESLIKRDCRQKDASQIVPGFGGVLDVIDSVIFAAPVAYFWLS